MLWRDLWRLEATIFLKWVHRSIAQTLAILMSSVWNVWCLQEVKLEIVAQWHRLKLYQLAPAYRITVYTTKTVTYEKICNPEKKVRNKLWKRCLKFWRLSINNLWKSEKPQRNQIQQVPRVVVKFHLVHARQWFNHNIKNNLPCLATWILPILQIR